MMGGYSRGGGGKGGGGSSGSGGSKSGNGTSFDEFNDSESTETATSVAGSSAAGGGVAGGGPTDGPSPASDTETGDTLDQADEEAGTPPGPTTEDGPTDDPESPDQTEPPAEDTPRPDVSLTPDGVGDPTESSPDDPDADPTANPELEFSSVAIVVATDPWDPLAWQMSATYKRLKRIYGDNISVRYVPLPSRILTPTAVRTTIDDPILPTTAWQQRLPDDTTLSVRALAAALELGHDAYEQLLRRFQVAVHAQGIDIEDRALLPKLVNHAGLDYEAFSEAFGDTSVPTPTDTSPSSIVRAGDLAFPMNEYVTPDSALGMSVLATVKPGPVAVLRTPPGFVRAFPFSSTTELTTAYDYPKTRVENELASDSRLECEAYGGDHFWFEPPYR